MSDEEYVVVYGEFADDKQAGVYLRGVFFGGIARDQNEAAEIASACINQPRKGTAFPKIIPVEGREFCEIVEDVDSKFKKLESTMIQAEDVLTNNTAIAKRRRK